MWGRGRSNERRSGPGGEEPWWNARDQEAVEVATALDRRRLGKGWRPQAMVNNIERLDPLGTDPASSAIRVAHVARSLTALDEGRAWRHRDGKALIVVRAEAFADDQVAIHRSLWSEQGEAALSSTWKQRWHEREVEPGWVEARRVPAATVGVVWDRIQSGAASDAAAIDWWQVEDHTDLSGGRDVTLYEHLMAWAGRGLATITVRHELGTDVDEPALRAVHQILEPLRRGL